MTTSNEKSYFDLHITGLGYLNRIREVKPKKGDAFLACDIAALNGPSDDVSYVRFDTRVSGSEAQHLVRRCIQAVDAEKKVMIGFRLGDLWADTFTYSKGKRAGEQGVSFKARLLFVSWIKVDGKLVYKAEPKPTDADERDAKLERAFKKLHDLTEGVHTALLKNRVFESLNAVVEDADIDALDEEITRSESTKAKNEEPAAPVSHEDSLVKPLKVVAPSQSGTATAGK